MTPFDITQRTSLNEWMNLSRLMEVACFRLACIEMKSKQMNLAAMVIRIVEFSSGGYKIGKIFAIESTYPKKIIEF